MTFGTEGQNAQRLGSTGVADARRMVDVCIERGVNLFDTADVYADGRSEEVLGQALVGKRDKILLATKVFFRMGEGPNALGLTRRHIIRGCEDSLRRLGTDYIDLYQAHGFDALTPLEETLAAFDDLVRSGKVRAIGCSNYSAWHLMKAQAISDQRGSARYASQQIYYSLVGRDPEDELVPLSLDQRVGILVWSPLAAGFLTGKFRRDTNPNTARRNYGQEPPLQIPEEQAFALIDLMDAIAGDHAVSVTQVALNWLIRKPGVTSVVFGARTFEQLEDNLNAAEWRLSDDEMRKLDEASTHATRYPYWHQRKYAKERNPPTLRETYQP
jgi:aryl-alcohol dehydrogenase-like predicted oxidoreductase